MARTYKPRRIEHDKKIGKRIKRLRKELGLTQEELAEKVGVSSNHISYIEIGDRRPSITLVRKIAKVLKTNLGELFAP